jgi:hypothetical protein
MQDLEIGVLLYNRKAPLLNPWAGKGAGAFVTGEGAASSD